MIYEVMEQIRTELESLGIFQKVVNGEEFILGKKLPIAVIKAGSGEIVNGVLKNATIHVIAFYKDQQNIEQVVDSGMNTVLDALKRIPDLVPESFTVDDSIFSPLGIESVPVIPPFGGFRIDFVYYA